MRIYEGGFLWGMLALQRWRFGEEGSRLGIYMTELGRKVFDNGGHTVQALHYEKGQIDTI